MGPTLLFVVLIFSPAIAFGQSSALSTAQLTTKDAVTVPIVIDQGRVVIDVDLILADGSTQHVRGWVDNGTPNLQMTRRLAALMSVTLACEGPVCSGTNPPNRSLAIAIGGMKISLASIREITAPATLPALAPGMSAEINIPSSILRNYDVLINFPDHEFTIALPGRLKFEGIKSKALIAENGLIQISSKIENKNYDLGLDLGTSASFLSSELFDKLANAHPNWPRMTGAVGPFNSGELAGEITWPLMRLDRVQYGPLFLTDVAVTVVPKESNPLQNRNRVENAGAGALSSEALINYRVGLDYAHSAVYFDIGRTFRFPDFDVIGLILRPGIESGFTIVGVADFEGAPAVAGVQPGDQLIAIDGVAIADSTLGQVWSLLGGTPGQERKLTIARSGKQFTVAANVRHFLAEVPRDDNWRKLRRD